MSILVTGASSGFGAAICETLINAGYRVIGAARRLEKLQALQTELGGNFLPLQMDVSDTTSVDQALTALPAEFAEIDCLINNAGLALGLEPAPTADFSDWLTMIQTNIIGLTFLTRQVLPAMLARKQGYVMNIGSIAGSYPYPGGNVYGASKAALDHHALCLVAEQHPNLRVVSIAPGVVDTAMQAEIRQAAEQDFPLLPRFKALKNEGGLSSPQDAAAAIARFLASPLFGKQVIADIRD